MRLNKYQKRWLEALRSGKYRRGDGYLKMGNKYCCLGVACKIFKDDFSLVENTDGVKTSYNNYTGTLPNLVQPPLKINETGEFVEPVLLDNEEYCAVTEINDSGKFSFKKIADIIEQNYKSNNFKSN